MFNFFGNEEEVKIEPIQDKLLLLLDCFYIKLSVKYLEDNSKIDINEIQHNSGIYTIYLRDSFSEHKKLMKLLIDCHQVVRDLCDSKGIADNETEAYLYGYIMGECFVSLLNKKKLFENVPKEKYIEFLCKSSKIRCHETVDKKYFGQFYNFLTKDSNPMYNKIPDNRHIRTRPTKVYFIERL